MHIGLYINSVYRVHIGLQDFEEKKDPKHQVTKKMMEKGEKRNHQHFDWRPLLSLLILIIIPLRASWLFAVGCV